MEVNDHRHTNIHFLTSVVWCAVLYCGVVWCGMCVLMCASICACKYSGTSLLRTLLGPS